MKKKITLCVGIFLIVQILKYILVTDYQKYYATSLVNLLIGESNHMTYSQFTNLQGYSIEAAVPMNQDQQAICEGDIMTRVIGTTSNYIKLNYLSMVEGAFFGKQAVEEGRKVAVISDERAVKLFNSIYATGNIIHINEEPYEVVGVYKKYRRVREYIVADGYDTIYVPITSKSIKEKVIEGIGIIEDGSKEDLEQMTGQWIVTNIKPMQNSNQEGWGKEVNGIKQLPMIVLFVWIGGKVGRKLFVQFKVNLKSENRNIWLVKLMICLGLYAVYVVLVFKGVANDLYIKSENLPPDNIFDIAFYWEWLKGKWIKANLMRASGLFTLEQLIDLLKISLHALNMIQYIVLFQEHLLTKHHHFSRPTKEYNNISLK